MHGGQTISLFSKWGRIQSDSFRTVKLIFSPTSTWQVLIYPIIFISKLAFNYESFLYRERYRRGEEMVWVTYQTTQKLTNWLLEESKAITIKMQNSIAEFNQQQSYIGWIEYVEFIWDRPTVHRTCCCWYYQQHSTHMLRYSIIWTNSTHYINVTLSWEYCTLIIYKCYFVLLHPLFYSIRIYSNL